MEAFAWIKAPLGAACVPWAQLASTARLPGNLSLRAKRGTPPVSSSLRAKRRILSSENRQTATPPLVITRERSFQWRGLAVTVWLLLACRGQSWRAQRDCLSFRHCERSAAIFLSVRHCERSAAICLPVRHCERSAAIRLSVCHRQVRGDAAMSKGHYVRLLVRHPELSEGSYPQKTGRLPRPRSSYQGRGHSSGGGSQ